MMKFDSTITIQPYYTLKQFMKYIFDFINIKGNYTFFEMKKSAQKIFLWVEIKS